ncbi:hypothetical protein RQP46_006067 [Phenoliferia psychrophenolica]
MYTAEKTKTKRNRKSASCEPCRKNKLRCSRVLPCQTCINRHEEEKCVWSPSSLPPLITARDRNETEQLKSEGSSPGATAVRPTAPVPQDEDLAALDLAQRLGQLTIRQFLNGHETSGGKISDDLLAEARRILELHGDLGSMSPHDNFVASPTPAPSISVFPVSHNRWTSTHEILEQLPARELAETASKHYWETLDWYLHPTPRHIFQQHADAVWLAAETGCDIAPFSLAVVLAVWGVGLSAMPASSKIPRKDMQAKKWLDLAGSALTVGRFLEQPDLEAVRALLVMATHFMCLSAGDDGGAGVLMLITAIQCCLHLQLHRDPSKLGGHFSAEEAEDRRRVFWLLIWVEQCASTATGRRFTMLHLDDIDTRTPLPLPDNRMGEPDLLDPPESEFTSLVFRIQIAQLGERVSHQAFGVKPVSYSSIMAFDHQINQLEAQCPLPYSFEFATGPDGFKDRTRSLRALMIHACLAQERLRLHRPYQTRSYTDETFRHSRETCISSAQRILIIHSCVVLSEAVWASMNYKAVCASIVLAIDLLQAPAGPHATSHRQAIREALERIKNRAKVSKLCHRATKVLGFLLQQDAEKNQSDPAPKRSRGNSGGSLRIQPASPSSTTDSADLELHHKSHAAAPPGPLDARPNLVGSSSAGAWDYMGDMGQLFGPQLDFATFDLDEFLNSTTPSTSVAGSNADPFATYPPSQPPISYSVGSSISYPSPSSSYPPLPSTTWAPGLPPSFSFSRPLSPLPAPTSSEFPFSFKSSYGINPTGAPLAYDPALSSADLDRSFGFGLGLGGDHGDAPFSSYGDLTSEAFAREALGSGVESAGTGGGLFGW